MQPVLARGPDLTLGASPAEWLPDYRDPTFSLAPLTHFVSEEAPSGLVELTGTPHRGTAVLPEDAAVTELELVPRRLRHAQAGQAETEAEAAPASGRVYFAIPRREPTSASPAASSSSSSATDRRVPARALPSKGSGPRLRPRLARAPIPGTSPTPRPSAAQAAPPRAEARSGAWRDGQWSEETGDVSIPTWSESLASRSAADVGKSVRALDPNPAPAPGAGARHQGESSPPASGPTAEAPLAGLPVVPSVTDAPEQRSRQEAAEPPVQGPRISSPLSGAAIPPATARNESASPATARDESPATARDESAAPAAAPLRRGESDTERALLGQREAAPQQAAGNAEPEPGQDGRSPLPIQDARGGARSAPDPARSATSPAPQPQTPSPRRLGLGEPIRGGLPGRPVPANQQAGGHDAAERGSPGRPDTGPTTVYAKSALGEMRVLGGPGPASLADPMVAPEPKGARMSADPLGLPSRPLIGARPLAPGAATQSMDLPEAGRVEVRQDAMAHARLRSADALGSTTGAGIDLAPALGAPESPQAIGVFAHELTHVYQQRAMGGRPMPDPSSAEGRRLEEQAESVRRTVERSPQSLSTPGGHLGQPSRLPGVVAPSAPSSGMPPRALAVAKLAASTVASAPAPPAAPAGSQIATTRRPAGAAPSQPAAAAASAPRPAPQRIVSPVAGVLAGAGASSGAGGTQHLQSGLASGTDDSVSSSASVSKPSEMRIPEQEVNRLYREFMHRFKNQLRWESDRNGRVNRFFKD